MTDVADRRLTDDQERDLPVIIQGGMGVGVSGWRLARAVAELGQLGVVSGVALDILLARRLQLGDPDGRVRHALASFPVPGVVDRVLTRYFVPGGIAPGTPYRPIPRIDLRSDPTATTLAVLGNYVEVFLAKEGHDGPVGINYLEKMQLTTPSAVYGAILAGVDYVLMGAGIPSEIPALLTALAKHDAAELTVTVDGAVTGERHVVRVEPRALFGDELPPLARPRFLAIVSTHVLAAYLARDPITRPDGFILETPVAGGHSAPPRGQVTFDHNGEPVYGARDQLDLAKAAKIGLPFWLAGGYASPRAVSGALATGAAGVQVGSVFALCRESGMDPQLRRHLLAEALGGTLTVRNHPKASPTGFPFKLAELAETVANKAVYEARPRLCDLGYLRSIVRAADGSIRYRCPAEPIDMYVRKGGLAPDAADRRCLCNGLIATIGLGQRRADGYHEAPVVTLGQDLGFLAPLTAVVGDDYTAADVIQYLLSGKDDDPTDDHADGVGGN